MRFTAICSLALVVVLAAAAGAAASSRDDEKVRLTAEGQRDAKAATLKLGDFTPGLGFKGGAVKSDPDTQVGCPGYHPKQSDLVENGHAKTSFGNHALQAESETSVLQTAEMVRNDFARTVVPALVACMRSTLTRGLAPGDRVVSVAELPFPKVWTFTRSYRAVLLVTLKGGTRTKLAVDTILVGWGRTEIDLTMTASAADSTLTKADVLFAKLLASRIYA